MREIGLDLDGGHFRVFIQQQKKQRTKRLVIIVYFSVISFEFYRVWTY